MNFEIQGQNYFLHFVPSQGRWFLSTPSIIGIHRFPVHSDSLHFEDLNAAPEADNQPGGDLLN